MGIPVFWLEPTIFVRRSLRRYRSSNSGPESVCPTNGYHDASVPFGDWPGMSVGPNGVLLDEGGDAAPPRDDSRWPTVCTCGYAFRNEDHWQLFGQTLYLRTDTGERMTLREAPFGAMYDATWYPWKGPDGISLMVVLPPNHHPWSVDSRASNCTLPDDDVHRCWVRHGDPRRNPRSVHIDKNGVTCSAGAGSIATGSWHGFLHNGELVG